MERFRCTDDDGSDFERLVQRYFRVQAISHMGTPDSIMTDHRLLLLLDGDELVGAACHRQGPAPDQRHFVYAAVEQSRQGRPLSNEGRASDVLWNVVANDIFDRQGEAVTVFARVHPENERGLEYCRRIGLIPTTRDSYGLVICAGLIARAQGPDGK